jgi:hypothetical protein
MILNGLRCWLLAFAVLIDSKTLVLLTIRTI